MYDWYFLVNFMAEETLAAREETGDANEEKRSGAVAGDGRILQENTRGQTP
jgi:hypothetical protein